MMASRVIRSRVPLRVSFCGGGTDVPPYPSEHGGVALSATINRYVQCSLEVQAGDSIELHSVDLDQTATFKVAATPIFDGNLDLIKAVFRRIQPGRLRGLKMSFQSDAPPGSG